LDFDKPGSPLPEDSPRCDYLLVAEDQSKIVWVVLLELKRGKLDANCDQAIKGGFCGC